MSVALINETPFPAFGFETELRSAAENFCLAVKASYDITAAGLRLRDEQLPLRMTDVYVGEPGASSLLAATDLVPYRPRTDVLVVGDAHAPGGQPLQRWLAELRVGDRLYKALQVTGPRQWQHHAVRGWTLSGIEAVASVPLRYEYAYGGEHPTDDDAPRDCWPANPVGRGYVGHAKLDKRKPWPAPQLLAPDAALSDAPERTPAVTACTAPIPGDWAPRVQRTGTTDERWRRTVAPRLPADFDDRHFNCAPDDQQVEGYLRGDEELALAGFLRTTTRLRLPDLQVTALMVDHDGVLVPLEMDLSTVQIDTTHSTLELVWRLITPAASWDQAGISILER